MAKAIIPIIKISRDFLCTRTPPANQKLPSTESRGVHGEHRINATFAPIDTRIYNFMYLSLSPLSRQKNLFSKRVFHLLISYSYFLFNNFLNTKNYTTKKPPPDSLPEGACLNTSPLPVLPDSVDLSPCVYAKVLLRELHLVAPGLLYEVVREPRLLFQYAVPRG